MKTSILIIFNAVICLTMTAQSQDIEIRVRPTQDSSVTIQLKKNERVLITVTKNKKEEIESWQKFFKRVSLSQTLQSVKDKDEAAFFNLVTPEEKEKSINFAFALAYNVLKSSRRSALKPFIEWQQNTLAEKEQNVFLSGINFESSIVDLEKWKAPFIPILVAAVNYKNDNVKEIEGNQGKIYFTPLFKRPNTFLPDSYFTKWKLLRFYYNIYDGIEYEHRSSGNIAGQKGDTWRHYFRITANFYPLSELLKNRLEVITDYTYRNGFSNTSLAEMKTNKLWKFTTNFVLITKKQSKIADIKIGYEHKNGSDPTTGFEKQELSTVALKIKI